MFWFKNLMTQKKLVKNLGSKNDGCKKMLGKKKLGSNEYWIQENVGSKKSLVLKGAIHVKMNLFRI